MCAFIVSIAVNDLGGIFLIIYINSLLRLMGKDMNLTPLLP